MDRAGLIESKRRRATGRVVSIYKADEAGLDDDGGNYVTVCEDHNSLCNHSTLTLARHHAPYAEWCEECQDKDEGMKEQVDLPGEIHDEIPADTRIELSIDEKRVSDLLCCAFEGGSNYWYTNLDYHLAEGYTIADFGEGGRCQHPDTYYHWSQLIPLVPGCTLVFEDAEDGNSQWRLDRNIVLQGVKTMAKKYPTHFANWMAETDDAITGDVFLQCCVFGEVIYG